MAYIRDIAYDTMDFSMLANSGVYYIGGFYSAPAAHAVLTIGGTVTQTYGTAGYLQGAKVFAVTKEASAGAVVLTVSGVSINDAGVKNDTDSEVLIADGTTCALNRYYETTKRWLGEVTYTLTGGSAGNTLTFNYGFAKARGSDSSKFAIRSAFLSILGASSETGFNCEILHHKTTGWAYSAAAFVPGTTAIASSLTDCGAANDNWANGVYVSWSRNNLNTICDAANGEGYLVRLTFAVSNSIKCGDIRIGMLHAH